MRMTMFLKRVLLLDAASCLGMGGLLVAAGGALAQPFGLPDILLLGAGIVLLPIGLFMAWVATRPAPAPAFVWLIILGNLAWAAKSGLVVTLLPGITTLGAAFVAVQAVAVIGLTLLEYGALRRALAPVSA
jgi:hypothetical protein